MKLLILTQKVDKEDSNLGFFHGWISELSKKFEKISVICLEKGEFDLPENVNVFSLGKESGRSKIKYVKNFFNLILGLNREYKLVFVHMNQEYVLLGGFFWKIMRKKIYFWRNHPSGGFLTHVAIWLSNKVFCTSKASFTAKYKKTVLMPVGINTSIFNTESRIKGQESKGNKILFLGRIAPIKKQELFIKALDLLDKKGVSFEANIYGDSLPKDEEYHQSLKATVDKLGLNNKIKFYKGVPNYQTPEIYNKHDIFVNLTPSGSFDKTILEATACGCLLVTTNESLSGEVDEKVIAEDKNPNGIAEKINFWINANEDERKNVSQKLQKYVLENHSLNTLINKLKIEFS